MNLYKTGKFICELRNEKHLSQRGLAEKIPLTRQAVSSWENGRTFPDSQVLKILSNIFDVTTDELIAGERKINNNKIDSIKLDLIDEVVLHSNKFTKVILITLISFILISTVFFSYYFFTSYNSIKVYKISGEGSNYLTENGILISTNQKAYLRIGSIQSKKYDIEKVELYYYKDNKKRIIYKNADTDILITEYYGYNEFFSFKDLKFLTKTLYLKITDIKGNQEIIKLQLKKEFSNTFKNYMNNMKLKNSKNKLSSKEIEIYEFFKESI